MDSEQLARKAMNRLHRDNRPVQNHTLVYLLFCLIVALLLFYKLGSVPHAWYDEGWAFSVARNWIELGHFGLLNVGQPAPATTLTTGWPAFAPIALTFRLLGIGVWQARLPTAILGLGAFAGLYQLARHLYNARIALGTLVAALIIPVLPDMHPIWLSRQALGEMPMLCFTVWGLVALVEPNQTPSLPRLVASSSLFALAVQTKPQALPFIMASLLGALFIALRQERRMAIRVLASCTALTLLLALALSTSQQLILRHQGQATIAGQDPYGMLKDRYAVLTLVVTPYRAARIRAVTVLFLSGLPTLVGLGAGAKSLYSQSATTDNTYIGRLVLWILCSSWLLWFVFLSIAYTRYIAPPLFLGSIFVAALVDDLSDGFRLCHLVREAAKNTHRWPPRRRGLASVILVVFVAAVVTSNIVLLGKLDWQADNQDLESAADFVNNEMPQGCVLETYESELFFLLDRPYHYPPDEVQHRLNRRTFLGQDVSIDYDPLTADPDYLIVGNMARMWGLYDDVLATDAFHPLQTIGRYELYERVR